MPSISLDRTEASCLLSNLTDCRDRGNEEDENDGGEDEEDDGFGTMNISAQRLPTADNALTRFIKRAIVNNGEAAQISHLRSMEWVSMPRSEEEILATLDQRFYEENFDPAQHMLVSLFIYLPSLSSCRRPPKNSCRIFDAGVVSGRCGGFQCVYREAIE